MAKTKQFKIDATRPFYAVVGAGDLAVEYARLTATDVQSRIAKVDIEPNALRDQALTIVTTGVEELTKRVEKLTDEAKQAQAKLEARVADLQADGKVLPGKVEALVTETVSTATVAYSDLAARGKDLVSRIRKQQSTQDAKAATKTTVAKAKTTRTQATKSAKKTTSTATRSAKATGTSAKKAASATTEAASAAAKKIGD